MFLDEKAAYHGIKSKKPASGPGTASRPSSRPASRLAKCAAAVKSIAENGTSKLKRKTVLALIDHITQTLPDPDDDFLKPVENDYMKAFVAVLAHQAHVEHISVRGGRGWETSVDFCTRIILRHFQSGDAPPGSSSRAASASRQSQRQTQRSPPSKKVVHDLVQCLRDLVLAPNAPLLRRAAEISSAVMQVLSPLGQTVHQVHVQSFTILNSVVRMAQTERISIVDNLMKDLVPLICRWWYSERASQDSLISSLRDELSRLIIMSYPHLEYVLQTGDEALRKYTDKLLDMLWADYVKRPDEAKLLLDDIAFGLYPPPNSYLHTSLFALRPHNIEKERTWAVPEVISLLEDLLWRSAKRDRRLSNTEVHPRKRIRSAYDGYRIQKRLKSTENSHRIAALQVICFVVSKNILNEDELSDLWPDLVSLIHDKHGGIASWAMLACARYAFLIYSQRTPYVLMILKLWTSQGNVW